MPLPIPIDSQISPTVNMYCDLFENLMEKHKEQLMLKNGTGLENVAARMFKTNQVDNLLPL